ncbi:GntR family transcriptional regulator [Angelakisella massiliensis]|uniref:GntR family transcriptional regulator n=1 Tax=Angelakisella massiliensis TaxID=1871018 RepID=UPI0008F876CA|nr:GntR family transcriptional regulator [Angelakisella massiliensis]
MQWQIQGDRPIYIQLLEQIKLGIISGVLPAGSRLPSVRDLAAEAKVNPNTMQKALDELGREGLVFSQRTSGRFITEDRQLLDQLKTELVTQHLEQFLGQMRSIGLTREEVLAIIKDKLSEEEKE